MKVELFTDGGSRGNPGPAAAGIVIKYEGKIETYGIYLGKTTNNMAEYIALREGLKIIVADHSDEDLSVSVFMDSELIVKQISGEYKVRDEKLKLIYEEVKLLINDITVVQFTHIPRAKNKLADQAVNKILDIQDAIKTDFHSTKT